MGKPRKSKSKGQQKHAVKRFQERFRINLTQNMRKDFWTQIHDEEAIFLEKDKKASKWVVFFEDTIFVVVYDKSTSNIVTVYPKDDPLYNRARKLIAKKKKEAEEKRKKHVRFHIDLAEAEKDIQYFEAYKEWPDGYSPEWAVKVAKYHYYDVETEMSSVKLMVSNWIEAERIKNDCSYSKLYS